MHTTRILYPGVMDMGFFSHMIPEPTLHTYKFWSTELSSCSTQLQGKIYDGMRRVDIHPSLLAHQVLQWVLWEMCKVPAPHIQAAPRAVRKLQLLYQNDETNLVIEISVTVDAGEPFITRSFLFYRISWSETLGQHMCPSVNVHHKVLASSSWAAPDEQSFNLCASWIYLTCKQIWVRTADLCQSLSSCRSVSPCQDEDASTVEDLKAFWTSWIVLYLICKRNFMNN